MKRLFVALMLTMTWALSWADSPLTSTDFSQAYLDHPMVKLAAQLESEADPDLPISLMEFLADPKSPIAVRLAVINKIGWNFDGKSSGGIFGRYLMTRYKVKDEKKLVKKIDAGTLAVYAYSKAMSNYFNVKKAQELAHKAVEKDRTHSFSIAFIASLIDAQDYLDSDWAMVYKVVADVTHDGSLNVDMRQEAIDNVMEYINLYKEYYDKQ